MKIFLQHLPQPLQKESMSEKELKLKISKENSIGSDFPHNNLKISLSFQN